MIFKALSAAVWVLLAGLATWTAFQGITGVEPRASLPEFAGSATTAAPSTTTTTVPATTTTTMPSTTTTVSSTTTTVPATTTTMPSTTTTVSSTTTTAGGVVSAPTAFQTFSLAGGTVAISFSAESVDVLWASPASGFRVEVESEPPGIKVEFRNDEKRSRIDAWWDEGPRHEIRERN